jgi:hypothetical protein
MTPAQQLSPQQLPPQQGAPDPLAQLRDIHLPQEAISNLPLAPGWWMLALLTVAALTSVVVWLRRKKQRNQYRSTAMALLQHIETEQLDDQSFIQQLNTLLKRTAMVAYPQQKAGQLHGHQWLDYLQESNPKHTLSDELKDYWANASYARPQREGNKGNLELQVQACQFAKSWIQSHSLARGK